MMEGVGCLEDATSPPNQAPIISYVLLNVRDLIFLSNVSIFEFRKIEKMSKWNTVPLRFANSFIFDCFLQFS